MNKLVHSVTLDSDKCLGCTNCIKRCPTEAIRVRKNKAQIISDRCIDCGECIRVCPHKAKKAIYDKFEDIFNFKYKIALPAPTLYGQFDNLDDVDFVLSGLLEMGFDDVFEVSRGAEIVSEFTRLFLAEHKSNHPYISTACPAVVRLITVRFPYLRDYLLPIMPPVELAARMAKRDALKKNPALREEDIGVFFISPCPAKVTYIREPIGIEKSAIDGALSMSEIYFKLVSVMAKIKYPKPLSRSGVIGIGWATSGGEAAGLLNEKYLAADGVENVIKVLDEIENENFSGLEFIELNSCPGGCVGGALTMENAFIAKARLQKLRKFLPISQNRIDPFEGIGFNMCWTDKAKINPAMQLDENRSAAMEMRIKLDTIAKTLPGLDCGACGSPSCEALAEDIVRGHAKETDCIFKMREKIQEIYQSLADMDGLGFDLMRKKETLKNPTDKEKN